MKTALTVSLLIIAAIFTGWAIRGAVKEGGKEFKIQPTTFILDPINGDSLVEVKDTVTTITTYYIDPTIINMSEDERDRLGHTYMDSMNITFQKIYKYIDDGDFANKTADSLRLIFERYDTLFSKYWKYPKDWLGTRYIDSRNMSASLTGLPFYQVPTYGKPGFEIGKRYHQMVKYFINNRHFALTHLGSPHWPGEQALADSVIKYGNLVKNY